MKWARVILLKRGCARADEKLRADIMETNSKVVMTADEDSPWVTLKSALMKIIVSAFVIVPWRASAH